MNHVFLSHLDSICDLFKHSHDSVNVSSFSGLSSEHHGYTCRPEDLRRFSGQNCHDFMVPDIRKLNPTVGSWIFSKELWNLNILEIHQFYCICFSGKLTWTYWKYTSLNSQNILQMVYPACLNYVSISRFAPRKMPPKLADTRFMMTLITFPCEQQQQQQHQHQHQHHHHHHHQRRHHHRGHRSSAWSEWRPITTAAPPPPPPPAPAPAPAIRRRRRRNNKKQTCHKYKLYNIPLIIRILTLFLLLTSLLLLPKMLPCTPSHCPSPHTNLSLLQVTFAGVTAHVKRKRPRADQLGISWSHIGTSICSTPLETQKPHGDNKEMWTIGKVGDFLLEWGTLLNSVCVLADWMFCEGKLFAFFARNIHVF